MMTRFCGIHFSHKLCKKKKTTCTSFNKIDSTWLFTCIRVAVKLGTTKKQINLGQASALQDL